MSHCAALVRAADPDRFFLVMMVPPQHREAMFALLALNAEAARIPDMVQEPLLGVMRLRYWRDVIEAEKPDVAARGNPVAEALARDILGADQAAPLAERRRLLEALLDGWGDTLGADAPPHRAAVRAHAEAVGGSLWDLAGLLLEVPVADQGTRQALRHVGTAWLLLGLARATPALISRGRLVLPSDVLTDAGVASDAVLSGTDPAKAGIRAGVSALASLARDELAAGRAVCREASPDRRAYPLLRQAIAVRHGINSLSRHGNDPFVVDEQGARLPVLRLVLSAVLGGKGM